MKPKTLSCRMCIRPARILSSGQAAMYCAGKACSNRDRLCQRPDCRRPFMLGADGAGTKYCSTECKLAGYRPRSTTRMACAWCEKQAPLDSRTIRVHESLPYLCEGCFDPIRHLADRCRKHHVPHEMIRRLLTDPGCAVCGVNIVEKVRTPSGQIRSRLVVDHDHGCCPGNHSCGECVRGLLCHGCNAAAGQMRNDAAATVRLALYLANAL